MNRNGFTLIEIMVGMLILVVGVMALASSTGYMSAQLQAADLRTERGAAYQQVVERLHAEDFDAVVTLPEASAETVGEYNIWWDVTSLDWALKEVEVFSEGPGFRGGDRQTALRDSVIFRIARTGP